MKIPAMTDKMLRVVFRRHYLPKPMNKNFVAQAQAMESFAFSLDLQTKRLLLFPQAFFFL